MLTRYVGLAFGAAVAPAGGRLVMPMGPCHE